MSAVVSQNHRRLDLFAQLLIQAQIKRNIRAPRHWPLWGEFIGHRWIPRKGPVTRKMSPFDDVIMKTIESDNVR